HNNQADCAELLIKHGALIDAPDCAGWTPLRWAISGNNKDVVALLKKRGVHITEFSEKDWDRYMKKYKYRHN
ncbi:MAG: ankyrin repeat domain-containing protein, partial [Akkermansia sp.]|nr:ankyrin repeat domain-containing protein [Akkermansia sp.]